MQKISVNLSSLLLMLLIALMATGQGCASKRLAKQAQKLEDAGMYEMAAENYFRSFNANRKNVESATGLKRNGQRALDIKAGAVNQAYMAGNDRETVYAYLGVTAYHQRISTTGIDLSIPDQATSYYEEAKPRFLENSFEEARLLLDEENFKQAESIFAEIEKIDPSYQDLGQYMKIAKSEPLYRQGVDQMNSGFYRSSYYTFTTLLNEHGAYKDAGILREDVLEKGLITIAISNFSNGSGNRNAHTSLKSRITADLNGLNNPFIQVVDDRNIENFLKQQELASVLGSEMEIGKLRTARAYLTGNLQSFTIREGRLQRTERRGFLKEVVDIEDPVTKEKSTKTNYHKVTYYEYQQENKASASFQFQLSSTETGAVLVSGVVDLNPSDQIHYAVFEGKSANLVPGHWEYKDKASPKDVIETGQAGRLQALLKEPQTIKTAEVLRIELTNGISAAVSQAVNAYNPEQ